MNDSSDPAGVHQTEALQPSQPSSSALGDPASLPTQPVDGSGRTASPWRPLGDELLAWLRTLASAGLYATLIVTFVFQVARVEGRSMAPTLEDQDRLIINKFAYRIEEPHLGDIVMLYYPNDPTKSFVKRLIAGEGDNVRIVDGKVYRRNWGFVPKKYIVGKVQIRWWPARHMQIF
jgi:signal peptidase I